MPYHSQLRITTNMLSRVIIVATPCILNIVRLQEIPCKCTFSDNKYLFLKCSFIKCYLKSEKKLTSRF